MKQEFWKIFWPLVIFAAFIAAIMLGSCASKQPVTDARHVRDSVVCIYKTVTRDSVRMRDSLVISYSILQRDSTVKRVDAATGKVIGTDSWHWTVTDKIHERYADNTRFTAVADSVAAARVKSDSSAIIRQAAKAPATAKKTHGWRWFLIGFIAGLMAVAVWERSGVIAKLLR